MTSYFAREGSGMVSRNALWKRGMARAGGSFGNNVREAAGAVRVWDRVYCQTMCIGDACKSPSNYL